MKRIIILAGAITLLMGTVAFGRDFDRDNLRNEQTTSHHRTYSRGHHGNNHGYCDNYDNFRGNREFQENRIDISEKQLDIRREMLKDSPDWNKIEKLNQEIGLKRAENRTMLMRERMEQNNY
ncbi:hypothetical protein [Fusobacterium sp.]|uniref:hypothetical protein n=1 Tax=Fusobacterium sp. TaxID=68766 RepID=UPI0025C672FB|nr:hypothetical protein [Fusobacterium sp.]